MVRKICLLIAMIGLMATATTMAWLYYGYQIPDKSPVRAKQVRLINAHSTVGICLQV